jgi:hypothetical protein
VSPSSHWPNISTNAWFINSDKCYHSACGYLQMISYPIYYAYTLSIGDTIDNLALDAFLVNARSVAHVIATTSKSTALIDAEVGAAGQTQTQVLSKEAGEGFGLADLGLSCGRNHEEL